jgi:hypothetical protein
MVVINITTKQNCGNNNKLLHRLENLLGIHNLPIAMVMTNIQPNNTVAVLLTNSNTILYSCKSPRQLQMPINTNATKCHHDNIFNL